MVIDYSKGLLINGSHIIDSAFMIFGNRPELSITNIKIIHKSENPSFIINNNDDIPIYVIGHDVPYHSRDVSVTFEAGRVSITQEGHKYIYEKRTEQKYYPGYFQLNDLGLKNEKIEDFDQSITNALNNLINAYENNVNTDSNLQTSKITQKVLTTVINECC